MQSIRKEVFLGLVSFFIFIALIVFYTLQYNKTNVVQMNSSQQKMTNDQLNPQSDAMQLSVAEVAKHNSENDCWIVIRDSVYVVTDYLILHPGGARRITPYCGQDATTAFVTQGGKGSHSQNADNDLATLMVGKINQTTKIDLEQVKQAAQNIPVREEEEEENE